MSVTIDPAQYDDNQRVRSDVAALVLGALLGFPISAKTMTNWRAKGTGPKHEYFGLVPLYRVCELKRWAQEEAIQPTHTRARNRERAAHRCSDPPTAA